MRGIVERVYTELGVAVLLQEWEDGVSGAYIDIEKCGRQSGERIVCMLCSGQRTTSYFNDRTRSGLRVARGFNCISVSTNGWGRTDNSAVATSSGNSRCNLKMGLT